MEPNTFTNTISPSSLSYSGLSNYSNGNVFRINSGTTASPNTVSFSNAINFTNNTTNQIMQNKVAVFKVTRDEDNKITKTEFLKEMWIETKNGQSVDFQVARDKDLAEYEMSELSIRTIFTLTF
jgi:hypothetical protein